MRHGFITLIQSEKYTIDLNTCTEEEDLGVTFTQNLTFTKYIASITSKANQLTGIVRRSFKHMDKDMFLPIYKAIICPRLEYVSSVWEPYLKKDNRKIEQIQHRANRMVKEVHDRDGTRMIYS